MRVIRLNAVPLVVVYDYSALFLEIVRCPSGVKLFLETMLDKTYIRPEEPVYIKA